VYRFGTDGLTALHYAALYGNVETVRAILELGGSAHAWSVAIEGHTEQAGIPVETGGDLRALAAYGGTALHMVASRGHMKILRLAFGEDGRRRSGKGPNETEGPRCMTLLRVGTWKR
jgi:ankyrin repeat protein